MRHARVFAFAPDCHIRGWRYGEVWRRHFYGGLRSVGLHVIEPEGLRYEWARPAHLALSGGDVERRTCSQELVAQIEREARQGLDAVISYCFSHDIELEAVDRVRAMGIPWINFFCDSRYAFHTVEELAKRTALNWFVESESEEEYRRLGVPYLLAPYALDPDRTPDLTCTTPERAVAFVGAAHPQRLRYVAGLRLMGTDLHVRGFGWPEAISRKRIGGNPEALIKEGARAIVRRAFRDRVAGHLPLAEYEPFLRGSQILLGLNEAGVSGGADTGYLKFRDIEFPGMGCCYLVQDNEDVTRYLEAGVEVEVFSGLADARGRIRRLAPDPERCRAMGRRARERVLAEHSWSARWPQIVAALA